VGAELRESLDELDARLRAFGAPIAGAFRPGAAPGRVRSALESEGVPAHDDLVAWWGWHDGADIDAPPLEDGPGLFFRAENTLLEPWHVLSLDDALRNRRWLRSVDDRLPEAWIPIALVDGQPVLLADAGAAGPAPLHVLDEGQLGPPPVQFASLQEFADLVVAAFDTGAVRASPMDERAPAADPERLSGELRRLAFW
jgi:hypothetical protein